MQETQDYKQIFLLIRLLLHQFNSSRKLNNNFNLCLLTQTQ
nr:MAG TPA: hypothetical protein [Bacteriophage sp.]DAX06049.1 MAG TPA: hypothetical protein [Bacteriophage sp.]